MTPFIVFAVVIILFAAICIFPAMKERNAKPSETEDDELLFDAETGTKYSVDEIVDGEIHLLDSDGVKTEDEIEKFYRDDDKDVERAKNDLRKKGLRKVDFPEHESDWKAFESVPWWENYTSVHIDSVYQLSSESYLFFMSLSYIITVGKGGQAVATDIQPMLWLKGPTHFQIEAIEAIHEIGHFETGRHHFFIINKIATPERVVLLLEALKFRNFSG